MPTAVPPPEPPAIVDQADGRFNGNWETGDKQRGSANYHPRTNTLTISKSYNDPGTRDHGYWVMEFATANRESARTAAETYKETENVPKTGAKNFYCSATFNGVTRTEKITHVPQLENMDPKVIKGSPVLKGLEGTGKAYSYASGGKIEYARGQAAVDNMMKQAKTVCGLTGNIPTFTP